MFTIERVKAELNKLSMADGLGKIIIPIEINGRLTRAMGRVKFSADGYTEDGYTYAPTKIEFARNLVENASDEDIIQVIKHEYAHYYILLMTGVDHGHDAVFKRKCAEIGCTHDKAAQHVKGFRDQNAQSKYEVWCDDCNEMIGTYSRRCKTIDNIKYCSCGRCHGNNLRIVQNW